MSSEILIPVTLANASEGKVWATFIASDGYDQILISKDLLVDDNYLNLSYISISGQGVLVKLPVKSLKGKKETFIEWDYINNLTSFIKGRLLVEGK